MAAERLLPTEEAHDLLDLTREICADQLAPQAAAAEEAGEFPRDAFALLGKSGLLSLPFAEEYGGGGQPYEVYLQVVEEIATAWPSVGVGVSVHSLTATPSPRTAATSSGRAAAGHARRRLARRLLPLRAAGRLRRQRHPHPRGPRRRLVVRRERHQAVDQQRRAADYYTLFARTSDDPSTGLSASWSRRDTDGHDLRRAREEDGPRLRRHAR